MRKRQQTAIQATVGFAADQTGIGVAYARLSSATGSHLLRVGFTVSRLKGMRAREVAYAALTAVATELRARGVARVSLAVGDGDLVRDVTEHRSLPPPLELPYIRLGCALNRFDGYSLIVASGDDDLVYRATSDIAA